MLFGPLMVKRLRARGSIDAVSKLEVVIPVEIWKSMSTSRLSVSTAPTLIAT